MIDVEDLSFDYPHGRVLDGVSFIVRTGAVLGLVGPPGAGKSTLLRCLASLETPEHGRLSVAGVDPQRDPAGLRRVLGYVAHRYGLYDALTVHQALVYAARAHGVAEPDASEAVARVVEYVGLEETLGAPVATLPSPKRERLAFAQAIVHAPRALLLDVPAARLEAAVAPRRWTWAMPLVERLSTEGVTVVICAAGLADLPPGCTERLELEGGRVVSEGVTKFVGATSAALQIAT